MPVNSVLAQNQGLNRYEQVKMFLYEHPTALKIAKMAVLVLGIGSLVVFPLAGVALGMKSIICISIATAVTAAALFALDYIFPYHHDMKNHVFKPAECEGGKLYYQGDVPILSLESDDPFKAGKAHGYLCGDAIDKVTARVCFLKKLAREEGADKLPRTIAEMRRVIPPEYLREMEGVAAGYNEWAKEQSWWRFPRKIAVDDILVLHLLPDGHHLRFKNLERRPLRASPFGMRAAACSSIVDRESDRGLVFARNMDWPAPGDYSLLIHRKHTNGLNSTVEVGMPGFIGTLTGMNERGLSLSMNVCSASTEDDRGVSGMPAAFYNRACLEGCATVQDVEGMACVRSPLGGYHLTVADRMQAKSIHFYQAFANAHAISSWQEGQPLSILNLHRRYPYHNNEQSWERQKYIDAFFQDRRGRQLEDVLSLPLVNNWKTIHSVVMEPQTGILKVAFDNAFAAKAPLQTISTREIFQDRIASSG